MSSVHDVIRKISDRYEGVNEKKAYGETTFFYNPDRILKNGVYFCTIKEQDGPNDKASFLDRDGIFRISTGITREEFLKIFPMVPKRAAKGGVVDESIDFKQTNKILMHPVYAWMSWICLQSPDEDTFIDFLRYIDISYNKAVQNYQKKMKKIDVGIG